MIDRNLINEYEWFLKEDTNKSLKYLLSLIKECGKIYPLHLWDNENYSKPLIYHLISENIDCSLTIMGDNIQQMELKINPHLNNQTQYTISSNPINLNIQPDLPWKLQQIIDDMYIYLVKGRDSLLLPRRKNFEEISSSPTMKILKNYLPKGVDISFYLNGSRLTLALYVAPKPGEINTTLKNNLSYPNYHISQVDHEIIWVSTVIDSYEKIIAFCDKFANKVLLGFNPDEYTAGLGGGGINTKLPSI
ncbi:protein rogdi-like isoform X4 [Gordionus sp. m RMFG-2023]|uniref:protein rogdi-like isoform X4 n=1 Tax=Gordionus sp. m RMFG-2023 TaxID=3053472 RepID=UPI0031FCFF55